MRAAELRRLTSALEEERRQCAAGIRRTNLGEVWHSRDLDEQTLANCVAWCGFETSYHAARGWFMVFPVGGETRWHKHAGADLVTATGIYGIGLIECRKPEHVFSVAPGQTIFFRGAHEHRAKPPTTARASLVINWTMKPALDVNRRTRK